MNSSTSTSRTGLHLPYEAVPITTDRLLLRAFESSDLDDVRAYQSRPDVVEYLAWDVHTREDSIRRLTERIGMTRLRQDGDELVYAVQPHSGPFLGTVIGEVIAIVDSAVNARLEVGWIFNPDAQGHGYATEAARALVRTSFQDLSAHKVVAKLDPRNQSSARLCERLGLRREALLRDDYLGLDGWRDTALYALLAPERLHAASLSAATAPDTD